jgi:nitrite reductase (NADH) small subunit
MSQEFQVGKTSDVPEGEGRVFEAGGRMVAVFNDAGTFRAIDDMCPHAGASLAEGWLDDGCVTCPWHAWQFRLSDGAYTQNPRLKVETYEVRVDGEDLFVTVPA